MLHVKRPKPKQQTAPTNHISQSDGAEPPSKRLKEIPKEPKETLDSRMLPNQYLVVSVCENVRRFTAQLIASVSSLSACCMDIGLTPLPSNSLGS